MNFGKEGCWAKAGNDKVRVTLLEGGAACGLQRVLNGDGGVG